MNADLHMAGELKNTGKGNLFVIFGEPESEILEARDGKILIKVKGVDVFDPSTGEVRSDGADGIACWFIDTDRLSDSSWLRASTSQSPSAALRPGRRHRQGSHSVQSSMSKSMRGRSALLE
jgi:hypothetical protein